MTTAQRVRLPLAAEPRRWNYRAWGTIADPVHKSQMSDLVGPHACTRRFAFDRQREAEGGVEREVCSGKTEMGTAIHATIERALRQPEMRTNLLAGRVLTSRESIRQVIHGEFERAVGNRPVRWYGTAEYRNLLDDGVEMTLGLFGDLHRHVRQVELVEAGFIAQLGDYWIEGHTDLVYRPRAGGHDALAFCDWKTGAQKPHQIKLDHGYESGFYAHALSHGLFLPTELVARWRQAAGAQLFADVPLPLPAATAISTARDDRAAMHIALRAVAQLKVDGKPLPEGVRTFSRFPDEIRLVHLQDYVPYEKKGSKVVERPEDVAYWSRVLGSEVRPKTRVRFVAGQQRGGAWMPVKRNDDDVVRLEKMLRGVIGWVRFGKFVEAADEGCTRCSYKGPCLTGGYELGKEEARELNQALRGLDLAATDSLGAP